MTTLTILSGGLDSTVALAWALRRFPGEHRAVSFDYGQRHRRELLSAARVAHYYEVPHTVHGITGLLHGSALLDGGDVPHGHYADDNMAQTVVRGRNLLFAAVALAASDAERLVVGVHAGDHPVYADCRPDFWSALVTAAGAYDVEVHTPFVLQSKAWIARTGDRLGAPMDLTWSCYEGGEQHCGRCGTCVERAEAFAEAGVTDPTSYADADYWKQVTA